MLSRREWDGAARTLADIWTLRKGGPEMICRLVNHPLGWELRLLIGGELYQSAACKAEDQVFETEEKWRAEAERKGWTEP